MLAQKKEIERIQCTYTHIKSDYRYKDIILERVFFIVYKREWVRRKGGRVGRFETSKRVQSTML